eukprot:TRINITY_DN56930_c0_g1_i1.p1 TRINITY_DN56930_c0_g1~~TRINITY_DN56930_c0_g1_i1.p1  ORF type:complete len:325 (+),score=43.83 TRINITY_DN56930_c0_g1_i1:64-1038(+)
MKLVWAGDVCGSIVARSHSSSYSVCPLTKFRGPARRFKSHDSAQFVISRAVTAACITLLSHRSVQRARCRRQAGAAAGSVDVADGLYKGWNVPENQICDCKHIVETVVNIPPLLSPAECDQLIRAAHSRAAKVGWKGAPHAQYATDDVKVGDLSDDALNVFKSRVEEPLRLRIAQEYRLPCEQVQVNDAFLVRYDYENGQQALAKHRDGSIVSSTVSLSASDDYEGGGTSIDGIPYRPEQGGAVLFAGARVHGGEPIVSGTRYILTIFWGCGTCDCHYMTQDENPVWEGAAFDVNAIAAIATAITTIVLCLGLYEAYPVLVGKT